jgi:hypothetical protein
MNITDHVPAATALAALRLAADANRVTREREARESFADITHCANLIASHHRLEGEDVAQALFASPAHILAAKDTPEGMTALGFYVASILGGDEAEPLFVSIH